MPKFDTLPSIPAASAEEPKVQVDPRLYAEAAAKEAGANPEAAVAATTSFDELMTVVESLGEIKGKPAKGVSQSIETYANGGRAAERHITREYGIREKAVELAVRSVDSFDDLIAIVNVTTVLQKHKPDDVIRAIEGYASGIGLMESHITRQFGIRDKAIELAARAAKPEEKE